MQESLSAEEREEDLKLLTGPDAASKPSKPLVPKAIDADDDDDASASDTDDDDDDEAGPIAVHGPQNEMARHALQLTWSC